LETSHKAYYLWNWNSSILELDYDGKPAREIQLPNPLRLLRLVPKLNEFIVVHDQLTVARYDKNQNNLWTINNPALIELSEQITSDMDVSDAGNMLAISCFDRGVFIYSHSESIRNIELEYPVSHVALSRNGKALLLADSFHNAFLIDNHSNILWEHTFQSEILFCRLNQTGSRALVYDKGGMLSCFEFYEGLEGRADFLELTQVDSTPDKREIWRKPVLIEERPFGGVLTISRNGSCFLFGQKNNYSAFDSQGRLVWKKSFMVPYSEHFISHDGKHIFLRNSDEVFIAEVTSGKGNVSTFYGSALRETAFDPAGQGFIVYDNNDVISYFSNKGKRIWKLKLKHKASKLRIDSTAGIALFKGENNILFIINLKNHQITKATVHESFSKTCIYAGVVYLGCESGMIYALSLSGEVQWKARTKNPVVRIIPFNDRVAVVGNNGNTFVFDLAGGLAGEAQIHNSKSILNCASEEILEIVPEKNTISCYKLLADELFWRIQLKSPDYLVSVSEQADRMILLDHENFHYHYLAQRPDLSSERANFLEF
jgi:outer membrane protein assembly factor BamB